ncbi:MAG TPA: hypothetical protein VIM27_03435 [Gaiellales bacterium]|jgi:uncharacterized membrane protein YgcG
MRARLTTILLVVAAITLPGVMAAAVFYASSEAIGDTPAGLTPHFGGGTVHKAAPEPAKTTVKRHRKPGLGAPSTTTATTDDHGGGSTGSDDGSGSSGHGSDGGGDS